MEAVLHYRHELHEFDLSLASEINCLKEVPKIISMLRDLGSDLHSHQIKCGLLLASPLKELFVVPWLLSVCPCRLQVLNDPSEHNIFKLSLAYRF